MKNAIFISVVLIAIVAMSCGTSVQSKSNADTLKVDSAKVVVDTAKVVK